MIKKLTWNDIRSRIKEVGLIPGTRTFGVPKNGAVISALLGAPCDSPDDPGCQFIIDDVIDSGRTFDFWSKKYPNIPFVALYDKRVEMKNEWIHFPWEKESDEDIQESVVRILEYIGENPSREGLLDTPKRMVKSWSKLFEGYNADEKILSPLFQEKYDELVLLKNIELYSTCEHHFLPFFGKCHIGYIPNGKVVGISKLARLMEKYSRRLQIQERLTNQIADEIEEALKPKGIGVIIEAQHFCMTSRGIQKQDSILVTSALRGVFMDKESARAEFMRLVK